MNNRTFVLIVPLVVMMSLTIVVTNTNQNTFASQSFCPPICLDEVQQHVNDAQEALGDGNIAEVTAQLNIVDSLLDQLDDMTSGPN